MGERTDLGDAELVIRTRAGDPEAYGELVTRYQRSAYALAFGVTRRHEDAQDAAQESFVVALERLDECRNPDKFTARETLFAGRHCARGKRCP
jgi:RNA polymerase sigma-70 factor (ECF subfamily)